MFNKLFLSIALIGASFSTFAANELTITPGSSVLLNPNVETRVTCTGSSVKDFSCLCSHTGGYYHLVAVFAGKDKVINLSPSFNYFNECMDFLKAQPSCK